MKTRFVIVLSLILAGSVLTLNAQTRRTTGQTREDQHPASSSTSRGEQRAPEPAAPPQHHDPPPQPVQPAPPERPHPHPVGGVPIEGTGPVVILAPVSPAVPAAEVTAPMWPVLGTEIADRMADPANSGYRFDDGEVVVYDDEEADVYYESQDSLLRAADDTEIQDLGVAGSVREDLRVRTDGWATGGVVRVQPGHQYAVWRWNGDVVRLYVQEIVDGAVVFDWMPGRAIERTGAKGPIFER